MRFPDSQRVTYSANPLVEVICQLKFPKILRIEYEAPYKLQDAIRDEYPNINCIQGNSVTIASADLSIVQSEADQRFVSYEFIHESAEWKLTLASDSIALSTLNYTRWEDFRERLFKALEVFNSIYSPASFSRVGLRYQNLIVRSELGLGDTTWNQLLKSSVLGCLVSTDLSESDLSDAFLTFGCSLNVEGAILRVRAGLAKKDGSDEVCYLIDSDCYTESTLEFANVRQVLDQFNKQLRNFFNWAITSTLRDSLRPSSVE
ncbi:TIGR04255 family protein [Synechococcus sp. CS-1333]|uniref:TIGR04255 family protein n=1 Tax=Synechococcus sp. CS-1333 TaxID=2848638 RepID=UPI0037D9DA67